MPSTTLDEPAAAKVLRAGLAGGPRRLEEACAAARDPLLLAPAQGNNIHCSIQSHSQGDGWSERQEYIMITRPCEAHGPVLSAGSARAT